MFLLICNDEICGSAAADHLPDGLPDGWSAVEYAGETPPELLEFVDGKIRDRVIPEPTPFVMPEMPIGENWGALYAGLEGTPIWARVFGAAGRTIKANAAFTLLLNTITVTRKIGTLEFAIGEVRDALRGIEKIGDFPPDEIATINQLLEASGFDLELK